MPIKINNGSNNIIFSNLLNHSNFKAVPKINLATKKKVTGLNTYYLTYSLGVFVKKLLLLLSILSILLSINHYYQYYYIERILLRYECSVKRLQSATVSG